MERSLTNLAAVEKIERAAIKLGLAAKRDASNVSGSHYVRIWNADPDSEFSLKVRVSDHELPTQYEQPDMSIRAEDWRKAIEAVKPFAPAKVAAPVADFTIWNGLNGQTIETFKGTEAAAKRRAGQLKKVHGTHVMVRGC